MSTGAGAPTSPDRIIASAAMGYAFGLAFYPAPASSPLFAALP